MFDVGFSELLVVGIVALVVIGPERLPKVARTAGVLLGRMQRYVQNVKADISREMQLDELKKLQAEMQESARNFEQSIAAEAQTIGKGVGEAVESAKEGLPELQKQLGSVAADPITSSQEIRSVASIDDSSNPAKTGA